MGKVLLVVNQPNACWEMAGWLERQDHQVWSASDLDSALSIIERERLDTIVVNIGLPNPPGIALLNKLSRRAPFIPTIVITRKPKVAQMREIMRAGAGDFIVPPVTEDMLGQAIARAIESRGDVREACLCEGHVPLAPDEKIAALGRMAAQVAHEVRNPLAGLQLYSLHLKNKLAGKVPAGEIALVDKIIDGISQLADTTERVLDFARTISLSRRRGDLNRIILDSLALLEPQLKEKRISVNLSLIEPGAYALLDEASMRSTLINLMLNAIQAMTEAGQMTISTAAGREVLNLAITDTGCGMTDEQISNLFEPFYTTKSQGLGLGMSFAARVVQLHGGEIAVESRLNIGTSIKIALPVEGGKAHAASR
jgi:signal transduction histidine kinase